MTPIIDNKGGMYQPARVMTVRPICYCTLFMSFLLGGDSHTASCRYASQSSLARLPCTTSIGPQQCAHSSEDTASFGSEPAPPAMHTRTPLKHQLNPECHPFFWHKARTPAAMRLRVKCLPVLVVLAASAVNLVDGQCSGAQGEPTGLRALKPALALANRADLRA